MTDQTTRRTTITEDFVAPNAVVVPPEAVVETDYQRGLPHGDEQAAGAVGGAAAGVLVGAVVGGPVGAVIGGAIGAASGATLGALDSKVKDDATVVTREVRRS